VCHSFLTASLRRSLLFKDRFVAKRTVELANNFFVEFTRRYRGVGGIIQPTLVRSGNGLL